MRQSAWIVKCFRWRICSRVRTHEGWSAFGKCRRTRSPRSTAASRLSDPVRPKSDVPHSCAGGPLSVLHGACVCSAHGHVVNGISRCAPAAVRCTYVPLWSTLCWRCAGREVLPSAPPSRHLLTRRARATLTSVCVRTGVSCLRHALLRHTGRLPSLQAWLVSVLLGASPRNSRWVGWVGWGRGRRRRKAVLSLQPRSWAARH